MFNRDHFGFSMEDRVIRGPSGCRGTNQEAFGRVQTRDTGRELYTYGGSRNGWKWTDLRCIAEVEQTGLDEWFHQKWEANHKRR